MVDVVERKMVRVKKFLDEASRELLTLDGVELAVHEETLVEGLLAAVNDAREEAQNIIDIVLEEEMDR